MHGEMKNIDTNKTKIPTGLCPMGTFLQTTEIVSLANLPAFYETSFGPGGKSTF